MIQIIKWCFYLAVILLLVGAIKYLFSERESVATSVSEISNNLYNAADNYISQTSAELNNEGQNLADSVDRSINEYAKELTN